MEAVHEKQANKIEFKWWCRCCSKTGYLYVFDLYFSKKEKTELGLGETVVLDLPKKLENTHCMLYIGNFFNSPTFCFGTVQSDQKSMAIEVRS